MPKDTPYLSPRSKLWVYTVIIFGENDHIISYYIYKAFVLVSKDNINGT